jgi:hypothetical protein
VRANAAETGFVTSVAAGAQFNFPTNAPPGPVFSPTGFLTNGGFGMTLSGTPGKTYVLQGSTNLFNWVPVNTNVPASSPFSLVDPGAANFRYRFYRAEQLP